MIINTEFTNWLDTFIQEKKLHNKHFSIPYAGAIHHISTDTLLDLIQEAPADIQSSFKNVVVKIDLYNGDLNQFLKGFAKCYIEINY